MTHDYARRKMSSHVYFRTTNCQRDGHNCILLDKGTLHTNNECSRINRENVVGLQEKQLNTITTHHSCKLV